MKKLNLAVVFGGKSAEHEVSIISAKNVYLALDKNKYSLFPLGISRTGEWFLLSEKDFLNKKNPFEKGSNQKPVSFLKEKDSFFILKDKQRIKIDVAFPVLHGPFGEDGTVQGFLKLFDVPFVGPGVLGSAVGMDKDFAKRLLENSGIPVSPFLVFKKGEKIDFKKVKKILGLPLFIKPANLGSSVGISKVKDEKDFKKAIKKAFSYDLKIILEKTIVGREIECSILGDEDLLASVLGEITPNHEFYSYKAKYLDDKGADLIIPAKLNKKTENRVKDLAKKTFEVLGLSGMSRVDFFVTFKDEIYVNEVNTIPGFTQISMYPKLLEKSGINQKALVDKLITLALKRHRSEKKLKSV